MARVGPRRHREEIKDISATFFGTSDHLQGANCQSKTIIYKVLPSVVYINIYIYLYVYIYVLVN